MKYGDNSYKYAYVRREVVRKPTLAKTSDKTEQEPHENHCGLKPSEVWKIAKESQQ